MPEEVGIKSYIDAFTVASNRARSVLILIIVTSVLVFTGVWNARPHSWINARLSVAQAALKGCQNHWDQQPGSLLSPEERRVYDRAQEFLRVRQVDKNDCQTIREIVTESGKVRAEDTALIHVSFFGVVLDVNDLGLIGGFTFWILFLWFKFSLRRELSNLKLVFLAAGTTDQVASYDLMAMRQVLSLPQIRGQEMPHDARHFIFLLYWLPAILQAAVLGVDVQTFPYGWSVSPFNVVIVYAGSFLALVMIVVFIVQCRRLSLEIEHEWTSKAQELGIGALGRGAGASTS